MTADHPPLIVKTESPPRGRRSSREGRSSGSESTARNRTADERAGTDSETSAGRGGRPGRDGDVNRTPSPASLIPERGIELDRLVDRLYQELERKSRIERERMGR